MVVRVGHLAGHSDEGSAMSRLTSKRALLSGLAAAGVLSVGILAPTVAAAGDSGTPRTASTSSADSGPAAPGDQREQRRAEVRGKLAEQLAAELGIAQEKVEEALARIAEQRRAEAPADGRHRGRPGGAGHTPDDTSAADRKARLKERLDQAVTDGKLTREQADAILAAVEAGVLPGWGGFGVGGHRFGHGAPGLADQPGGARTEK